MSETTSRRLVLDPTKCDGRGLCHDYAPDLIRLDEWGYPVLPGGSLAAVVSGDDVAAARAAVGGCPALALHLERLPKAP